MKPPKHSALVLDHQNHLLFWPAFRIEGFLSIFHSTFPPATCFSREYTSDGPSGNVSVFNLPGADDMLPRLSLPRLRHQILHSRALAFTMGTKRFS